MYICLLDLGTSFHGRQRQLLFKAQALQSDFFQALVVCPAGSGLAAEARLRELELVELPNTENSLSNIYALWRQLRRRKPCVLHAFGETAHQLAWRMKNLFGDSVHLVLDLDAPPAREPARTFKKYLASDALLCASTEIATYMQNAGAQGVRTHVLLPVIVPADYQPRTARHDGRFVYGMVAQMNPGSDRGHSVLLQALTILSEINDSIPWEVRIFGGGSQFSQILEEAQSLNVESWLSMLGEQDTQTLLAQCDVLLVPSVHATCVDMAVLEGWAVGLPVICSNLPANMHWTNDKINCLLVPPANPLALASAMLHLMRDQGMAQDLAHAGHESVEHYAAENNGLPYIRFCHKLVPSAPPLQE